MPGSILSEGEGEVQYKGLHSMDTELHFGMGGWLYRGHGRVPFWEEALQKMTQASTVPILWCYQLGTGYERLLSLSLGLSIFDNTESG